nr:unnamed protein product [Spirometra erinaceieuropaei]
MPFASFRNIQKKNARLHRERAQPAARARLGILPKKKDFILRSRDEEGKRNRIRELKRKALTKNEDEFYFAMQNSKLTTEKGYTPLNTEKEYDEVVLKEMLTHDVSFLNRELQIEMSKIADLESRLNLLPGDPSVTSKRLGPKRTVFIESVEEARLIKSSPGTYVPTRVCAKLKNNELDEFMSLQENGYRELSERLDRAEKLKLAIQKRAAKHNVMKNKGVRYKVESKATKNHPPVYKFEHKRYR